MMMSAIHRPSIDELGWGPAKRMASIEIHQEMLRADQTTRLDLFKKFHKAHTIVATLDAAINMIVIGLGGTTVITLAEGASPPFAIATATLGVVFSTVSMIARFFNKQLEAKASKNKELYNLANNQIVDIDEIVSEILSDETVSESDFKQVSLLIKKYYQKQIKIQDIAARKTTKLYESVNTAISRPTSRTPTPRTSIVKL